MSVQISIAVRHGHLSEAAQDKLKEKVARVGRYFDRLMAIEVVVDLKDEHVPEVEIMVSAEHKHDFVARDKGDKLFSAVDSAVQKIEQQLRKYKEKVQKRHRSPDQRRQELTEEVTDELTE
jgi:putative sigma-54 modulation protein